MKVLVTGSSRGIGKAICELFLERGHHVVGMDIQKSTIDHSNYTHLVHDIADRNYPAIEGIEVLVNNAGMQAMTEEDIHINLTATIALTEHYAFHEGIKAVINISSASAITGSEFPHYAAAKGGLNAYTKNIALRLAPYGATANGLCPGGVITELNQHILEDENLYEQVLNEALLHRWAEPEEIAEWTYFLAVVNKAMTGENLLIDNGEALKSNFIW